MPKIPLDFKKAQEWLTERGFEQGFLDKALYGPIAVLALSILISVFWMKSSSGRLTQATAMLSGAQANTKLIDEYAEIVKMEASIQRERLIPGDRDASEWIQVHISSYASVSGMEVVSFNPAGSGQATGFVLHRATFELKGSYHSMGQMVAFIENSKPYIGIERFDLRRSEEPSATGIGKKVSVQLTVFALAEPALTPAPGVGGGT